MKNKKPIPPQSITQTFYLTLVPAFRFRDRLKILFGGHLRIVGWCLVDAKLTPEGPAPVEFSFAYQGCHTSFIKKAENIALQEESKKLPPLKPGVQ